MTARSGDPIASPRDRGRSVTPARFAAHPAEIEREARRARDGYGMVVLPGRLMPGATGTVRRVAAAPRALTARSGLV
jgi:hypothetical protein